MPFLLTTFGLLALLPSLLECVLLVVLSEAGAAATTSLDQSVFGVVSEGHRKGLAALKTVLVVGLGQLVSLVLSVRGLQLHFIIGVQPHSPTYGYSQG